jgi:hypothetical protein
MHRHRTPGGLEEHALIDRALLQLMLDLDRQRPWAEEELARAVSIPGDVRDGLRRLRASKLIHRWNDLAVASHPAVRFHEITQGVDPDSAHEHHDDRTVLEALLARSAAGEGPLSEHDVSETFAAEEKERRVATTDALGRLDGAGLIERRGGHVIVSEVARRFDELMTL